MDRVVELVHLGSEGLLRFFDGLKFTLEDLMEQTDVREGVADFVEGLDSIEELVDLALDLLLVDVELLGVVTLDMNRVFFCVLFLSSFFDFFDMVFGLLFEVVVELLLNSADDFFHGHLGVLLGLLDEILGVIVFNLVDLWPLLRFRNNAFDLFNIKVVNITLFDV